MLLCSVFVLHFSVPRVSEQSREAQEAKLSLSPPLIVYAQRRRCLQLDAVERRVQLDVGGEYLIAHQASDHANARCVVGSRSLRRGATQIGSLNLHHVFLNPPTLMGNDPKQEAIGSIYIC